MSQFKLEEGTFEFYGGMAMLYLEKCLKGERWPRGGEIGGGQEERVRKEVRRMRGASGAAKGAKCQ